MTERYVALLGRPDTPTDAIREYCEYLRTALAEQGVALELFSVRWPEIGWGKALEELRDKATTSRDAIFVLQYTALMWSRRGFPWRVLKVLRTVKGAGTTCSVMFHDSEPFSGSRVVDRVRRGIQIRIMRKLLQLADLAIFNVPLKNAPWLDAGPQNAVSIPVGANLPAPEKVAPGSNELRTGPPSVAVFSLSEGRVGEEEVRDIAEAIAHVARKLGPLRLVVVGRNAESNGPMLKHQLADVPVEVVIHGLRPAEDVARVLRACDVMLFVRGPISSRRGSAIAGIACGLPVVGREGWETGWPLTEAGVVLIGANDTHGFGPALLRVLSDKDNAASLAERSRQAYSRFFSWEAIAAQYAQALRDAGKPRA